MLGLAAASKSLEIIKQLQEIKTQLGQAELKGKLAEVYSALADVKMALADCQIELRHKDDEITSLIQQRRFSESLVEVGGFKYRKTESGLPVGLPYCPTCETN